jgi:hypothetical protein
MFTAQEKLRLKSRESIKIKAAGIVHNPNSTRLWWKDGDKTGSLSIVFDNPVVLKEVAEVLKGCVLIDDYEVIEKNKEIIRVQLYKKSYYEYEVMGRKIHCTIKNKINWRELIIKHADVLEIANYMIYQRCIKGQPLKMAKVITMFSRNANTKTAA